MATSPGGGSRRVAVITPTLGRRPEMFRASRRSLLEQRVPIDHIIVSPQRPDDHAGLPFRWLPDPGRGLTEAVNTGIGAAEGAEFILWLNDDDFLLPGGLDALVGALDEMPSAPAAIGRAVVVDRHGRPIGTSPRPGIVAALLPWGPGAMFMPSVLLRRSAILDAGGLDARLTHAADLDLMLRLRTMNRFAGTRSLVAVFRWHPTSLTVADARASLREAEAVRRRYLAGARRELYRIWSPLAGIFTRAAKRAVTRRAGVGSDRVSDQVIDR